MGDTLALQAPPDSAVTGSLTQTILLADDEEGIRRLFAFALRGRGYRVLEAANGLEALRAAESFGGRIDLLLTDVMMPFLDGPGLRRRLQAGHPEAKVLFISAYPDGASGEGAFLQKPFTPRALLRKIHEVLGD
jgi:CheY-like chemotaxis protein